MLTSAFTTSTFARFRPSGCASSTASVAASSARRCAWRLALQQRLDRTGAQRHGRDRAEHHPGVVEPAALHRRAECDADDREVDGVADAELEVALPRLGWRARGSRSPRSAHRPPARSFCSRPRRRARLASVRCVVFTLASSATRAVARSEALTATQPQLAQRSGSCASASAVRVALSSPRSVRSGTGSRGVGVRGLVGSAASLMISGIWPGRRAQRRAALPARYASMEAPPAAPPPWPAPASPGRR